MKNIGEKLLKKSNTSGITLIALVVTIILLIILATVSINAVFGEGGIIKRAEQSNDVHGEQAAREKLVLKLNEYKIEIYEEKVTKADEKDKLLKQRLEEVGPTTEATDPKYYEVEVDGWIFWVNRDTLEIVSRGKAGKTVPVITNVTLTTGKNDIKVDTAVIGGNGAKYKYYYKKEGETTTYTLAKETDTPSYTITGLEENVRYTVKVEVTNDNGTASKETVGRTGIVPSAEGAITFGDLVWNNGKAEVTITKTISDDLEIQYKIDTGEYKTITSGSKVTGLELNSIVTARLWDGLKGGNTASLNVQDATNPNEATITLSKQTAMTGEKITADVSQSDNESGIDITKCRWIYNQTSTKLGEDETKYTGKFTSANETISLTATSSGDYYLHVLTVDRAGNKTEKISDKVTIKSLVTKITLDKTSVEIEEGATETITATVEPANADNRDVEWTSDDDSIATVAGGVITAVKAGTVKITATAKDGSGIKAECTVTVKEPGPITVNGNELRGKFIEYGVEYLDYQHGSGDPKYTATNGWRIVDYTVDDDGKTLSNLKIMSTGYAGYMSVRVESSAQKNNYSLWIKDTTKLTDFKNNVLGADYIYYTGSNTYFGLQAAAGLYYNLGQMSFTYTAKDTGNAYNLGNYVWVKNKYTNKTYNSTNRITATGDELFKARDDASIRLITLPEINKLLGRNISCMDKMESSNELFDLFVSRSIGGYIVASPVPDSGRSDQLAYIDGDDGDVVQTAAGGSRIRPLIEISSNVQLTKQENSDGTIYYKIVDIK